MATNLETYQRILETFNREGVDGVMPYFTDDVEVYDPDLPKGPYRGPEAAKHVARYKLPKQIVRLPELVRSPAGKADYRWAKAQAAEAAATD